VVIEGGYQPVTPIFLGNLLTHFFKRTISWPAVRIAFACLEMSAIREAAIKSKPKWKKKKGEFNEYRRQEISELTGLNLRAIGKGLSQLNAASVLKFNAKQIQFANTPQTEATELTELLCCRRGARRLIPVPRRAIRFVAGETSSTLARVMIAYWVRGLSLRRISPQIGARGTVKANWIADIFQLSLRSVRYAQAKLRSSGWIGKDTGSKQWKLNRDGAYFEINVQWKISKAVPVVNFAPPVTRKCIAIAPPIENKFTPSELKNQSTALKAGVLKPKKEMRVTKPSIYRIFQTDLFDKGRIEMLFLQAVQLGWARQCEADRLKFFGAAIRARQAAGDPERIFAGIVRKRLWKHVTSRQENEARLWLQKEREVPHGPNPRLAQTLSTLFQKTAFRSQSLTTC
jgi:hypothetical protein